MGPAITVFIHRDGTYQVGKCHYNSISEVFSAYPGRHFVWIL